MVGERGRSCCWRGRWRPCDACVVRRGGYLQLEILRDEERGLADHLERGGVGGDITTRGGASLFWGLLRRRLGGGGLVGRQPTYPGRSALAIVPGGHRGRVGHYYGRRHDATRRNLEEARCSVRDSEKEVPSATKELFSQQRIWPRAQGPSTTRPGHRCFGSTPASLAAQWPGQEQDLEKPEHDARDADRWRGGVGGA